jgi:aryl-alcohol dehydrogenase-like predicted oxidoreductase
MVHTYWEEEEMIPPLQKFGVGMIPWSPVAMEYLTRPHKKIKEIERGNRMKGIFLGNTYTVAIRILARRLRRLRRLQRSGEREWLLWLLRGV